MTEQRPAPTLGRVLQVLRDLGFTAKDAKPGVLALAHPASGAEFLFRDRPPETPARENELANLRAQLTFRGVVTDSELDRLLWDSPQPASAPQ